MKAQVEYRLVFTNREDIVEDVQVVSSLGHSNHI